MIHYTILLRQLIHYYVIIGKQIYIWAVYDPAVHHHYLQHPS